MMNAPKYIEKNQVLLRDREIQMKHHQEKLAKIAGTNKVKTQTKQVESMMKKKRDGQKQINEFKTNEKNIVINKDNQILLNKLVEISAGKWSSINQDRSKVGGSRQGKSASSKSVGPTSLNMLVRKKETERIEKENHAFAKRLFDKQAILNKKKLDQEWLDHIKYKKQISKMPGGKTQQQIGMQGSMRQIETGDQDQDGEQLDDQQDEQIEQQDTQEQDQQQEEQKTEEVTDQKQTDTKEQEIVQDDKQEEKIEQKEEEKQDDEKKQEVTDEQKQD